MKNLLTNNRRFFFLIQESFFVNGARETGKALPSVFIQLRHRNEKGPAQIVRPAGKDFADKLRQLLILARLEKHFTFAGAQPLFVYIEYATNFSCVSFSQICCLTLNAGQCSLTDSNFFSKLSLIEHQLFPDVFYSITYGQKITS